MLTAGWSWVVVEGGLSSMGLLARLVLTAVSVARRLGGIRPKGATADLCRLS